MQKQQKARQAYLDANNVLQKTITLQPTTNSAGLPIFNEPVVPPCIVRGSSEPGTTWALGSIEDNINCLNEINKTHLDSAYDDTLSFLGGALVVTLFL